MLVRLGLLQLLCATFLVSSALARPVYEHLVANTATARKALLASEECEPGEPSEEGIIVCEGTEGESVIGGPGDDSVIVVMGATVAVEAFDPLPEATGIDGGPGNDTIVNIGSVSANASSQGGATQSDPQDDAGAKAVGIQGGEGDDTIVNTGSVAAIATTTALGFATGPGGVKIDLGDSEAFADATGIEAAGGDDSVTNTGDVSATATATALKAEAVVKLGLPTSNDSSTADATALGIAGGDGQDSLTNDGSVSAVSTATSGLGSAEVALIGSASGDASSTAKAHAAGLDGGAGDDTIVNRGDVSAVATATAGAVGLSFSKSKKGNAEAEVNAEAVAIGIGGDKTELDSQTDKWLNLTSQGLNTGFRTEKTASAGTDTIINEGTVTAVATAVSEDAALPLSVEGAASADTSSEAKSSATGIDAGAGDDTVINRGDVTAVSTATAGAFPLTFSKEDESEAKAKVAAEAEAIGLRGDGTEASSVIEEDLTISLGGLKSETLHQKTGSTGNDTITNEGTITAVATAVSGSVAADVSIEGAASTEADSTAKSLAVGLDAGAGDDWVENRGAINAISTATAGAVGLIFSKEEDATAKANVTAEAEAIGLRGDGTDASSRTEVMLSITKDGLDTSTRHETVGSTGNDTIINEAPVTAVATAASGTVPVAVSMEENASAEASSTAKSLAVGIEAGAGDDRVENRGAVSAISTATAGAVGLTFSKKDDASAKADVTAEAEAFGLRGDGTDASSKLEIDLSIGPAGLDSRVRHEKTASRGDDTIINEAPVTAVATAFSGQASGSVSMKDDASSEANSTAKSLAVGLDAGGGDDRVENRGAISAISTATGNALTFEFSKKDDAEGKANVTAEAEAIGLRGDGTDASRLTEATLSISKTGLETSFRHEATASSGDDTIINEAPITAVATALGNTGAGSVSMKDSVSAEANSTAKSLAVGLDAGAGDDRIENRGAITAVSTAQAGAIAFGFSEKDDASAKANVTAEAEAFGQRGDGTDASSATEADLSITGAGLNTGFRHKRIGSTGDDTIINEAAVTAVATAVSGAGGGNVSMKDAVSAEANSTAKSLAVGLEAGAGDDRIENRAAITAVSTATAGALAFDFSKKDEATVKTNATAEAEAIGLRGDGTDASNLTQAGLSVSGAGVDTGFRHERTGSTGDDRIDNDAAITAVATAASGSGSVSVSIKGGASAEARSRAKSLAIGLDAGAGNDRVDNRSAVTAVSTATAGAVGVRASDSNDSSVAISADAEAEAIGVTGDGTRGSSETEASLRASLAGVHALARHEQTSAAGNDRITNDGDITAVATAASGSLGVDVSISGAASVEAGSKAKSNATALDAGSGDDTVVNNGTLTAVSTATAGTLSTAVSGKGGTISTLKSIWSGGSSADATATGMSGDSTGKDFSTESFVDIDVPALSVVAETDTTFTAAGGVDDLTNDGDISATAVATVPTANVAVALDGMTGAATTAEAKAKAVGIDAGTGNDTVLNRGSVTATGVATASAVNVAVSKGAAVATDSIWDGSTTADAEAVGITGDGEGRDWRAQGSIIANPDGVGFDTAFSSTVVRGNDDITNEGSAVATAVATAPVVSVPVSVEGAGVAASTTETTAKAAGIDAGSGSDKVLNKGQATATAVSTAAAVNVTVSKGVGVAGNPLWDGATQATAEAVGISGDGEGRDWNASGSIAVTPDVVRLETDLASTVVSGDDDITNEGSATATAVSTVGSLGVAVSVDSVSAAVATAEAASKAVAIDAGSGSDTVLNKGSATATAVSTLADANISVSKKFSLAGNGLWNGGSEAKSEATGISGDGEGRDWNASGLIEVTDDKVLLETDLSSTVAGNDDDITNEGAATATAVASVLDVAVAASVDGAGVTASTAEAASKAAGIDAGSGDDTVLNKGQATATAVSTAAAANISVNKGVSVAGNPLWDGTTQAKAEAVGISGDGEGRDWNASGSIAVTDDVVRLETDLSSTVVSGDDEITNEGAATATAVSTVGSLGVAVSVDSVSAAVSTAEAESKATAIDAGSGSDTVLNKGSATATAVSTVADANISVSKTFSIAGNGLWNGGSEAKSEAIGISGDGEGRDWNASGLIEVTDDKVLLETDLSSTVAGDDDDITNEGTVTATAVASLLEVAVAASVEGGAGALAAGTAESRAVAIDAGTGDDTVHNSGSLTATAVSTAIVPNVAVSKSVAVASGGLMGGGTSATADVVGISADGQGRNWNASGSIEVTDDKVRLESDLSTTVVSGDDEITHDGSIVTTAVVLAPTVDVAVSAKGLAATSTKATADSKSVGIDAGAGDDTVTSKGSIVSTSVANADAISVTVTPSGVALAAGSLFDGGAHATSEAVGISGDGTGRDWRATGLIETSDDAVKLETDLSSKVVSGDDTITNDATVVATSTSLSLAFGAGVTAKGVAGAVATASTDAKSAAIDAGAGDDTVTNRGTLVSTAVSSANTLAIAVTPAGVAGALDTAWDGGTTATSEALGISGDGEGRDWQASGSIDVTEDAVRLGADLSTTVVSGDDEITNDGAITTTAVSEALSANVAVAVKGVAAAVSTSTAESRAAAIDAGSGDDEVTNRGDLVSTSVSNANAGAASVTLGGVALAAGTLWDGGATAKSEAIGISGDGQGRDWRATGGIEVTRDHVELASELSSTVVSGNDTIENDGKIVTTAVSATPSVSVAVAVAGVAGAVSAATAESRAAGIDAGAGDDEITNRGELVSTAVSNADAISVAVAPAGLAVATDAIWDVGAKATAESVGISGDGQGRDWRAENSIKATQDGTRLSSDFSTTVVKGDDEIDNEGKITSTAVAVAPSVGVSVAVWGVGAASAAAETEARAAAIDAGSGDDEITNRGELVATSVSNADAISAGVAIGGVATAAGAFWDDGTTASSEAVGISGDGAGRDWRATASTDVQPDAVALESELSTTVVSGDDKIENEGKIAATSVAAALEENVAVAFFGAAGAITKTSADSRAAAIDAGAGDDEVTNSGELVSTSVATAFSAPSTVVGIGAAVSANGVWDGGTKATSEAVGISGDGQGTDWRAGSFFDADLDDNIYEFGTTLSKTTVSGDDEIKNSGNVTVTSVAVAPTLATTAALIGGAASLTTSTAESRAAAIDAGSGRDRVHNTGELTATAVANADTVSQTIAVIGAAISGDTVWEGGTSASAEAIGISGDGRGKDEIVEGRALVTDDGVSTSALLSSGPSGDDDVIDNEGKITATAVTVAVSGSLDLGLIGSAAATANATTDSRAAAIDAGIGNDEITNTGELAATSVSTASSVILSLGTVGFAASGNAVWDGGTTATTETIGISGDGRGRSESAQGSIEISDKGAKMGAKLSRSPVSGDDKIVNEGKITAVSVAVAPVANLSVNAGGIAVAASGATADSRSAAIDAGDGGDEVANTGELTSTSVATADSVSLGLTAAGVGVAGNSVWDGGTKATSEAVGIAGDGRGSRETIETSLSLVQDGATSTSFLASKEPEGDDDEISNKGTIKATSVVVAPQASFAVAVQGVAAAVSTATADSRAAAIDAGAGNDKVTNDGHLTAVSVANADSVNVSIAGLGVTLASDALWDGGSKSTAEAVGISGDGQGRRESLEATLLSDQGVTTARTSLTSESVGGDDVIDNTGDIETTAVSVVPSISFGATVTGATVALSNAEAEARAAAIDASAGDDEVTNSGKLEATAIANGDGISFSLAPIGFAVAGNAVWDGGTKAKSDAVGISGDGDSDRKTREFAVEAKSDGITLVDRRERGSLGGDDEIKNSGQIVAESTAVSVSVSATLTGAGVAAAVSTATAEADSAAIDAGAGDDEVTNSGLLVAKSRATAVTVNVASAGAGVALAADAVWDAGTTAKANAFGISGDGTGGTMSSERRIEVSSNGITVSEDKTEAPATGKDIIESSGEIRAEATSETVSTAIALAPVGAATALAGSTAEANAAAIDAGAGKDFVNNTGFLGTTANATAVGVEVTVSAADVLDVLNVDLEAQSLAKARAAGIDGGDGADEITNEAILRTTATADASGVGVTLNLVGRTGGDTAAKAEATAVGIDGGAGRDSVTNKILLSTESKATAKGVGVDVQGVGLGNLSLDGGSVAMSRAMGIGGGDDRDEVNNEAFLETKAIASASGTKVELNLIGTGAADTGASAEATAIGIDGGDGNDFIENRGPILSTAEADTVGVEVGVGLGGLSGDFDVDLQGKSLAKARSVGIGGGTGNDTVENFGPIASIATAEVTNASVNANVAGVTTALNGETTAESLALGLDGGEGRDGLTNHGQIALTSTAKTTDTAVSVNLLGKGDAIAATKAKAKATGITGGAGSDELKNHGGIIADEDIVGKVTATAPARTVTVNLVGATSGDASTSAESQAIGMDGGEGDDTVVNFGTINLKPLADASAGGVEVTLAGASNASAGAEASATAIGLTGGLGNDDLFNRGSIDLVSTAKATADKKDIKIVGVTEQNAASAADASVTGMSGGEGNDLVENTGSVRAEAAATTTVSGTTFDLAGVSSGQGEALASARAIGLAGGGGKDLIYNDGKVDVDAKATNNVSGDAITIIGGNRIAASALAEANATGIEGGTGDDEVVNYGEITVDADPKPDVDTGTGSGSVFVGGDSAQAKTEATVSARGIDLGEGANEFKNASQGAITVRSAGLAKSKATSTKFALVVATSKASSEAVENQAKAVGVYALDDGNVIVNDGALDVTASPESLAESSATGVSAFPTTVANATAKSNDSQAYGVWTGGGEDDVYNRGSIAVVSAPTATAKANATAFGAKPATANATAEAKDALAVGIQTGEGDDLVWNEGSILIHANPTATANASPASEETISTANAQAVGVRSGDGDDTIVNAGTIETRIKRTDNNGVFNTDPDTGEVTFVGTTSVAQRTGLAIDAGAGDDRVELIADSRVIGRIELGLGDDLMFFEGTPTINGLINAGSGTDTFRLGGTTHVKVEPPTGVERLEVNTGTLEIDGSYALAPGGLLRSEIASSGDNGQLLVNGTADLDGTLAVVPRPRVYKNGETFDIVTAQTIQPGDEFSDLDFHSSPLLSFDLADPGVPNIVQVEAEVNSFDSVAENRMEHEVAGLLDRIAPSATGDLEEVLGNFQMAGSSEFDDAFASFSPDSYDATSVASTAVAQQNTTTFRRRLDRVRAVARAKGGSDTEQLAAASTASDLEVSDRFDLQQLTSDGGGVWMQGFYETGNQEGDSGFTGFEFQSGGAALGLDYTLLDSWIVGAGFGLSYTDVDFDRGRGDGDITSYIGTLYTSYFEDLYDLDATFSIGAQSFDNDRLVQVGATQRRAESSHDGLVFSASPAAGLNLGLDNWTFRPFTSLNYIYLDEERFEESGAGSMNLTIEDRTTESLTTQLGLRVSHRFELEDLAIVPHVSGAWEHDYEIDDRPVTASLAGTSGSTFTIESQELDQDSAVVGAGISLIGNTLSGSVEYRGQYRGDYDSHAAILQFRVKF